MERRKQSCDDIILFFFKKSGMFTHRKAQKEPSKINLLCELTNTRRKKTQLGTLYVKSYPPQK